MPNLRHFTAKWLQKCHDIAQVESCTFRPLCTAQCAVAQHCSCTVSLALCGL